MPQMSTTTHALVAAFIGGCAGVLQQAMTDGINFADTMALKRLAASVVIGGLIAVGAYFSPSPSEQQKNKKS